MQTAAGKFECYVPPRYEKHTRRIIYIGKATAGDFSEEHASALWFNKVHSPFWTFARNVSHLADPNCDDLSNLAWSNIFKEGVISGNPHGELAEAQRTNSIEALRTEVSTLKPSLIVLVNAGYYEEIPKAAFDITDGEVGERAVKITKTAERFDLWSRAAYDVFPPIFWMYHPQHKRTEYLEKALLLVQQLTGW